MPNDDSDTTTPCCQAPVNPVDNWHGMMCVLTCQEFEKEAMRKKNIVEKLLQSSSSSSLDGDAELAELTDAWEVVRTLEMNRSARLQQALQLVSDTISLVLCCCNMSAKSFYFFSCLESYL